MTALPDKLIETPPPHLEAAEGLPLDVLDEILGSLRLTGGVVIDGEFSGEFCVPAQFGANHFSPFFKQPDTLISYHYVRSGQLVVEVDGMAPVVIDAGTVAIAPRNDPHNLASRSGLPPADPSQVSWVTDGKVHRVSTGTDGPKAEIWCGFLGADKGSAHPLLDALPPLLTLDVAASEAQWLESSMRFLAEQNPSSEIVARLAELFLSQAIRDYLEQLPPSSKGWLRGLTDPAVSKALSIIHARYAEELDVEGLAREAGVSRTVLGERFAELIGEPPMRYCAQWRMRMAANMLRDGRQNTANIAYAVGFNSEAAFNRAFKREYGEPPATWRRRVEAEAAPAGAEVEVLPKQVVRYCSAKDGTRLAFSAVGEGPPLVKAANWLNHLEYDWKSPVWKHWLKEFTRGHCLIRYDERGNGMSDWDTPDLSFEAFVDDLESVVEHMHLEQFDLLGISQGAAVAIAYAVRHPKRVRKMVLYGGYAAGWEARGDVEEIARREAMITLTQTGWGADHPAYRQLFTNLYIPGGTAEQIDWFNEMQKVSASPENAARMQRVLARIDVRDLLEKVEVPTLIVHARDDQVVPFAAGEYLADHIPGAIFVPIKGDNHILLDGEAGWTRFARASREFLCGELDPALELDAAELSRPAEERIESCQSSDGTRIAYAVSGEGFPLVKSPNWMTNLSRDRENPVYRHWIDECSRTHRFVRTDMRGFGMSEHEPKRFEFEAMVEDLEAVIDHEQIEQCDLLGAAHGAAIAIAYAARHPERVRKLLLVNSFAAGWRVRADPDEIAWRKSLLEMNSKQMAFRRSSLGEMFITLYFPSASNELIEWHNEHLAELGPNEILMPMIDLAAWIDVRAELAKVQAPTLVVHARKDGNAPLEAGRAVAAGIKDARFVEIDSANHILLGDEPAWPEFVREMRAFLDPTRVSAATPRRRESGERPDPRPNQLVVSGTPTAVDWINRHNAEFLEANPDLLIQLDPNPNQVNFEGDEIDCALRFGKNPPARFAVEELFRLEFTPMCSPEFVQNHPEIRTPDDLRGVARITPNDPWWEEWWRHFGLKRPEGTARSVDMGAQMLDAAAAMNGRGVALLTPLFWRDELAEGRLVRPLPQVLDGGGTYWLLYPKARAEWSKIRRFSDWLHRLCERSGAAAEQPAAVMHQTVT